MSSTSTPNNSPASIQPMHNPSQAARIVLPQAPLGNTTNGKLVPQGMGTKALLEKKMAKSHNPKFVSPTDNMVTPVTQKLNAAKQKRFAKVKPTGKLFAGTGKESDSDHELPDSKPPVAPMDKDANPFE